MLRYAATLMLIAALALPAAFMFRAPCRYAAAARYAIAAATGLRHDAATRDAGIFRCHAIRCCFTVAMLMLMRRFCRYFSRHARCFATVSLILIRAAACFSRIIIFTLRFDVCWLTTPPLILPPLAYAATLRHLLMMPA